MPNLPPLDKTNRDAFTAAYQYMQKHSPPEPTETYWNAAADDMNAIAAQHGGNPFVVDLLVAVYGELERSTT